MIKKIPTNSNIFLQNHIDLIRTNYVDKIKPYYTVFIGNNGTGKSTLLSELAKNHLVLQGNVKKIIALSNSISDKFPMDKTYRLQSLKQNSTKYSQLDYVYLGLKGRNNFISANTQFRRGLDIFAETYGNEKYSKAYQHIFDYLEYEPIIKIEYKISKLEYNAFSEEKINEKLLRKNNYYVNYGNQDYKEILSRYDTSHEEVLDFLRNNEKDIIFNFSDKNTERMIDDEYISRKKVKEYKILEVLRVLRIVKRIEYKIYKTDGTELYFKEASSGEIAILSSLFSLIPLIDDRCLILIDEPEISLHPYWQSQYIKLLDKILEGKYGCHVVIATHSHLMLSDLPYNQSTIISFKKNKRSVNLSIIEEDTFGWSAENILLNIFGVPSTRNYYLSDLVSDALILLKDREVKSGEFENITKKLRMYLPLMKDNDPFKDIINAIVEVRNE